MDKTNIDFKYSIEQIKREIPSISFPQDKILDSNKMNATFKNMEDSLNTLYENTRYLEDAIDYCHAFLNLRIEEYSQDIKSTLKSIEDIRDINKNASYLEYAIPFRDDASIKKDRDNSIIPTVINKNDYLMLGIKNEKNIEWADMAKKSAYVHYKSNLEKALFGELDAVVKYRKIMATMPSGSSYTLLMSIMTDELRHATKYNFLIHNAK